MLKRFGFTNLMVIGMGTLIMIFIVDYQQPSWLDIFIIGAFSLTILIYLVKIALLFFLKKGD